MNLNLDIFLPDSRSSAGLRECISIRSLVCGNQATGEGPSFGIGGTTRRSQRQACRRRQQCSRCSPIPFLMKWRSLWKDRKKGRKRCPAACVSSNSTSSFLTTVSGSQKQERQMLYRTQDKAKSGKFGCDQLEKTITVLSNEQQRLASSSTQRYADIKPQTSHQD